MTITSVWLGTIPVPRRTVVTTGTMPTVQKWTDRTRLLSHPLRDGIHDKGLDLETFLTCGEP